MNKELFIKSINDDLKKASDEFMSNLHLLKNQ